MGMDRQARRDMERAMRGPEWRRQLACEVAGAEAPQRFRSLDELTEQTAEFLRLSAQGSEGAQHGANLHPRIALAEKLWENPLVRDQFKLLVVANLPLVEIADRLGIDKCIVQTLEELRYDVRPMLPASGWVLAHVIMAEADRGHDDLAAQLRMAYFGGPDAGRMLVDAKQGLAVAPIERLAVAATLLHAKFQQAIEMPLSPEQGPKFLELYAQIHHDEQQLHLEREKLALRAQRWAQRYELARERLALEREQYGAASSGPALTIHQPPYEAA